MNSVQSKQRRLARHYVESGGPTDRLSRTVGLAARSLRFGHARLNILDDQYQYTISDYRAVAHEPTPRDQTACQYVVDGGPVAVDDLSADARFAGLPGVTSGEITRYLGVPLLSRESTAIGSLCVFDSGSDRITSLHVTRLREFADIVEDQLDLLRRVGDERGSVATDATRLAEAIERAEIVPWYQPIVALATGRTVGYEALARWEHPSGRIEDPSRFIPVAEDGDLVIDLDRAVMRRVLADVRSWRTPHSDMTVNVNLSTLHLEVDGGVEEIHRMVLDAGLEPDAVRLELTESRRLKDMAGARAAVGRLRAHGYRMVLDDFGTGWSSLDWLVRLPITGIKIDRVVTRALGSDTGDAVIGALCTLAAGLGVETTIEGIGSQRQAQRATELGCDYAQGYYWSAPVPALQIGAA